MHQWPKNQRQYKNGGSRCDAYIETPSLVRGCTPGRDELLPRLFRLFGGRCGAEGFAEKGFQPLVVGVGMAFHIIFLF